MNLGQNLEKALMLLDRSRAVEAEVVLREIVASTSDIDLVGLRARAVLGELLFVSGRIEESLPLLRTVVDVERDDDVLDSEQTRARELVAQAGSR